MLDAFKNISSGKGKEADKQTTELELLIATAREERSAISAMLTALTTRSAKLSVMTKSLEQVTDKTSDVNARLDELASRITGLDDRTKGLDDVERRIASLKDAAEHAEQSTLGLVGPEGELQKHREAFQQLSAQVTDANTTVETLRKERTSLDEFRAQLRTALAEVKQSAGQTAALKSELDQLRSTASSLTQDYTKMREASREVRDDSAFAMTSVKEIETKLGPVAQLIELSRATDERLTALNSLAEHVARKTKALEGQQQAVEHAVVQSNRVNELIWAMDIQIAKIKEGMKEAAKAEETITRVEKLTQETTTQLDAATKAHQQIERDTGRLSKDATGLLESVRGHVDALAVRKQEFGAVEERLRGLQTSMSDAESKMESIGAKDQNLLELTRKIDGLTKQFDTLFGQADELARKQLSLESLHERLVQVDELSKKTQWQMTTMRESRADLDVLRAEIQDFYKSHAEVAKLHDKLGTDRAALEAFGDRMTSLSSRAPELEAKMDAIIGRMKMIDDATQKAAVLTASVTELDGQITRVSTRAAVVEKLEGRLDSLNAMSHDVDKKLEAQLARRAELETLQNACDGLGTQMLDAQARLESIRALQTRLTPLVASVDALKQDITAAKEQIDGVKSDQATVAEHERRFAELVTASRAVGAEVAERTRQMQVLSESLARSSSVKDELLEELDRVQGRHRETVSHVQATEDQLARAEAMFKQLEARRTQLTFGEKKLAGVETRLADMKQLTDELDKSIQVIASREQLVGAVKAEVQTVHEIGARAKADLTHLVESRAEIAAVKGRVDDLLSKIGETEGRIASIDSRRRLVDEVHTKTNAVLHVLDDVRLNLETLGEQKTVIDHVAERVQQLEFTLQEARTTIRTLQHERELAERIERGIRQLRATGKTDDGSQKTA